MKSETEPITNDEWLLRRVHVDYFTSDGVMNVAFRPRDSGRDPDTNGISLFRESCLYGPEQILATIPAERRLNVGIVRLPMSLFQQLGLTIISDPIPEIPGHVVIVEMNTTEYRRDKRVVQTLMTQLAFTASDPANILLRPTPATS